ncbi:tRNA (adenosine(37)-N6)-threonylcarbamoyltransferase complex transferase subunit TsaD [Endomicrobium proavitum]|uniref:tRNA N6-adenosine threonylcarbamoyltransferase n=1 Tax=Endomicrobium proavitum TaxID=1408281 RepID=A0A0G3WI10_9BACT|nr:tRNA (adenosine(37)-N6)-threonylcarbamoyltransferase complex transferase subunit TsaD [Endomicrobium proavitum]AKL97515.1 O-sialoglycoprotein endopeptidase [Endomicrobium proavitum]
MNILAIETSCDETSASVVSNGTDVKSAIISSQIAVHAKFFGVVPELASREHIKNINPVIAASLKKAGFSFDNIDAIAFTSGPGLAGALLVGATAAKTLASVYSKPLIPVNHLEGHLYSSFIENKSLRPPFLSVIISGGHTELIVVQDFGKYKILGATRDDAAGEAFDKAAKMLGLSYPGGPVIDKRAADGNPEAVHFTRPYLKGSWDFSFSGIKTALLNYLKQNPVKNERYINDICASFRAAIAETLCFKSFEAAKTFGLKRIALGGGVSSNALIRKLFLDVGKKNKIEVFIPSSLYCTDNAAMIGCAAYFKQRVLGFKYNAQQLKSSSSLQLTNWK